MFRFYSHNILQDKGDSWFTVHCKAAGCWCWTGKKLILLKKMLTKLFSAGASSVLDDGGAWENLCFVFDWKEKLVIFLIEDNPSPLGSNSSLAVSLSPVPWEVILAFPDICQWALGRKYISNAVQETSCVRYVRCQVWICLFCCILQY